MENPFNKFSIKTKQVTIKSLNNAKITLKQPTIADNDEFRKGVFNSTNSDGKPQLNYDNLHASNLRKISSCMVEPKMTIEELNALSVSADEALAEIISEIDNWEGEKGN